MTSDANEVHPFACPHCAKRLKAPSKAFGKTTKCPKCGTSLTVPFLGSDPAPASVAPPSLNTPAIADLAERQGSADEVRAKKAELRRAVRTRSHLNKEPPGKLEPVSPGHTVDPNNEGGPNDVAARSVFDDDLPELDEMVNSPDRPRSLDGFPNPPQDKAPKEPAAQETTSFKDPPRKHTAQKGVASKAPLQGAESDNLDALLPELSDESEMPPLVTEEEELNAEYRIVCRVCGTPQHVPRSSEGMKIKCPDCYVQFKVPPPPKGWSPKKRKKIQLDGTDLPLAPPEQLPAHANSDQMRRERSRELLEKAEMEIADDRIDQLYDSDFDTAGFMQRTFGFFSDIITMSQVIGFGMVFAGLFALAQFSASDMEGYFGQGVLLLTAILVPVIAFLFSLPMLSGCLALIESVANKQKCVREFPAFNIFDNAGDLLLLVFATAGAIVPGYLVGAWLGGSDAAGLYVRILGTMVTCFALFPIFLLSMLDNGSLFQPVSSSVIRSIPAAAEAWGGYYLKTLVAFFVVLMLWFILLGRSPLSAAFGGFLLPLLLYFTCQQIGALAEAIGDHLSFEFTPRGQDDEDVDGDPALSADT